MNETLTDKEESILLINLLRDVKEHPVQLTKSYFLKRLACVYKRSAERQEFIDMWLDDEYRNEFKRLI